MLEVTYKLQDVWVERNTNGDDESQCQVVQAPQYHRSKYATPWSWCPEIQGDDQRIGPSLRH